MTQFKTLSRRGFLTKSAALGCSLAASPLLTPVSFAAVPGDNRLVVIILRGGMDGLDVVRPVGDKDYAGLRPGLSTGEAPLPLDGFFALHPALTGLHGLWARGEFAPVHAVSTPYRDKRSHFDGQDILEAGVGPGGTVRDGWLNRLVQILPGASLRTAFAIGREDLLVLHGDAPVSHWAPDTMLGLSPQTRRLLERMYHDEALFQRSMSEAVALAETLDPGGEVEDYGEMRERTAQMMRGAVRGDAAAKTAGFTAERLLEDTRIASFSIGGWDTHTRQRAGLARVLGQLETAILTLRDRLGPVWDKTAVLAMTEFGRTARENGSGGTDHGTGGAMLLAGGAVRGGQVYANWPGLTESALYQGRDLMPTADLRLYTAAALAGLFGVSDADMHSQVFPGLASETLPGILL